MNFRILEQGAEWALGARAPMQDVVATLDDAVVRVAKTSDEVLDRLVSRPKTVTVTPEAGSSLHAAVMAVHDIGRAHGVTGAWLVSSPDALVRVTTDTRRHWTNAASSGIESAALERIHAAARAVIDALGA